MFSLTSEVRRIRYEIPNITFVIADRTGEIDAVYVLSEDETITSLNVEANSYARATGRLINNTQTGVRSLSVSNIVQVGFDEFVRDSALVEHQSLQNASDALPGLSGLASSNEEIQMRQLQRSL